MVMKGNEPENSEEARLIWRRSLFPFRFTNLENGDACFDAWNLGKLEPEQLEQYQKTKAVRLVVGKFLVTAPGRKVLEHPFKANSDDPHGSGTEMLQPTTINAQRKTRWDLSLKGFGSGGRKERARVIIELTGNRLKFYPGFEVTAKTKADSERLVNLWVNEDETRASFWVLSEGSGTDAEYGFNVGLVAIDDSNGQFSMPILVDPAIEARG
jgi:hypothetical protein